MKMRACIFLTLSFGLLSAGLSAVAQTLALDPNEVVREAVNAELTICKNDDSHWRYRDEDRDTGIVSFVVESPQGALKQPVSKNGRPLTPAERASAEAEVRKFMGSSDEQRKQRQNAASDDKHAEELTKLLPHAFIWSLRSNTGGLITLDYRPDPSFHPPDMESRVMGSMTGEMIVDAAQHRIRTLKGHLTQDVTIGWGVLGRLQAGGTFDVERRQVVPDVWQITGSSVHINGHALFFKTISEQQDEVKTDFVEVPNSTTLQQAANMLQTMVDNDANSAPQSARASR